MELGIAGLASGFDWRAFVDQMVEVERSSQRLLRDEQGQVEQRRNAYGSIKTQLAVLQNRLSALKDPSTFDARQSAVADAKVASVSASAGAPLGTFEFNFTQLATAAKLNGTANVGAAISPSDDVSGVVLSGAGFSTSITAGTFTVNGEQITLATSDTLQDVFSAIETATGGSVTASYDPATDRISLNSAEPIVLGSATDSSNFLRAAKLYNNGTGEIASSGSLGGIRNTAVLASANFATAIDDGGAGVFKVNGVEITYSTTSDSLNNVIDRINNSTAGVLASYDQVNDRVVLTNKSTGDVGIHIQDVTGNFAAATGLATGALDRGKNLLYTVNGGGTLISETNTVTQESSGIAGLNVSALSQGVTHVTVSTDTGKIKAAIEGFIAEYNKVQSIIDTQTASSTDSKGKVTAGVLAGESDASSIASKLRSIAYQVLGSFSADMDQLADLGITTNGDNNNLEITDSDKLDTALANNLAGVKRLFADGTSGIAVLLNRYVDDTAREDGSIDTKSGNLAKQIASIDTQMSDLERIVQSNRQRLIDSFIAMETAQAQISQQLQFLMQRFGTSSGAAK